MNTIETAQEYLMPTYGRLPLAAVSGSGCVCEDEEGRRYLDFGSGIGTNVLGYCQDAWADAVCAQTRKIAHLSNYYYSAPQSELAERLCGVTGFRRVFLCNSGAEANECAIKIARKYSFDHYGAGRSTIIALQGSFHGRTLATLAATGQEEFHRFFDPFPQGFVFARPDDFEDMERKMDGSVCAVLLEVIQGEGGVNELNGDYVRKVAKLCEERDVLLMIDEVQTGCGRTGKFLAAQCYGVKAAVTTLAKALGGGLPIGACLADEERAQVLTKGTHGSTFGGNPVVCAGANAVLDVLTREGFLEEVDQKARYLRGELSKIGEVASLSGLGMMIGVTLRTRSAGEVLQKAFEHGLLVLTAKEKVRLLPPLTITKAEMDEGLAILREVLET